MIFKLCCFDQWKKNRSYLYTLVRKFELGRSLMHAIQTEYYICNLRNSI